MTVAVGYLSIRRRDVYPIDILIINSIPIICLWMVVAIPFGDVNRFIDALDKHGPRFVFGILAILGTSSFFFAVMAYTIIQVLSSVYYSIAAGARYPIIIGLSFLFFVQPTNAYGVAGIIISSLAFFAFSASELWLEGAKFSQKIASVDDNLQESNNESTHRPSFQSSNDEDTRVVGVSHTIDNLRASSSSLRLRGDNDHGGADEVEDDDDEARNALLSSD
eukprot:CAMPEP_0197541100 /NCGR_PEP_ID=MMETSP1318-20131121/66972_1 /TAXON_ID=552666 /ORGANISM="Partenskyella glossopodia, Strain RCC365" /LENGTH=220 /DNA_ID=CAMNT_0043100237 /DNA_START=276 /DNA_END=938 /DNA_ORIENTATION=+